MRTLIAIVFLFSFNYIGLYNFSVLVGNTFSPAEPISLELIQTNVFDSESEDNAEEENENSEKENELEDADENEFCALHYLNSKFFEEKENLGFHYNKLYSSISINITGEPPWHA